jgi:proteasome lid subunit RPN8/RPN11
MDFKDKKSILSGKDDVKKEILLLRRSVHDQIFTLINKTSKIELIGIGFGDRTSSLITMNKFVQLENLDQSQISFSLDYEVLLKEILYQEKKGRMFLGFFHTHPYPSEIYPSAKDCFFMKYWPYPYLWMIGRRNKSSVLRIFFLYQDEIMEISYRKLDE